MKKGILLAALVASAIGCAKDRPPKEGTSDSTGAAPVVNVTPVTRGTHGMSERVNWLFSPDRSAVLVVLDPVGVEGEPVPNSFFAGDERTGFQIQMDSVWDVAISPDWKSVAFGRALGFADGTGVVDPGYLATLARRTAVDTATLRAASFAGSGMSEVRSLAQAGLIRIPADPRKVGAADSAAPKMFPVLKGWRVRWTTDGATIALGNNPARALDAEMSVTWSGLDPRTGEVHGTLPASSRIAEPKFFAGPVLHSSENPDLSTAPPIRVLRGGKHFLIETQRGVITIAEEAGADSATKSSPHVVGAGIALAATASGGYIIALVPRTNVEPGGIPVEAVVYRVTM